MKRSELKSVIKECMQEILIEEGVLSGIISEVAKGLASVNQELVTESRARHNSSQDFTQSESSMHLKQMRQELDAQKRQMKQQREQDTETGTKRKPRNDVRHLEGEATSATNQRVLQEKGVDLEGIKSLVGNNWKKHMRKV